MRTSPPVVPGPHARQGCGGRRRRGVARRLLRVGTVLALFLGVVAIVVNVVMVGRLERIDGAFAGLTDRPPASAGPTFLMVATEPGAAGGSDVPWLEGTQSAEAVMIVEVAPDARSARVETLPARSGASAAVSSPRPSDTVAAVEAWSGRRVDHLIGIDWDTFVQLAEHSGVDTDYTYGAGPSDQHDFLQRVIEGALRQELRKRPLDLYRTLSTTVDGTAVDTEWSVLEIDALVVALRNLRSFAITYAMAQPG